MSGIQVAVTRRQKYTFGAVAANQDVTIAPLIDTLGWVSGVLAARAFTDLVLSDSEDGTAFIHKVPSTVEDPSVGMIEGIKELCAMARENSPRASGETIK